jgi:hypothetical protein
VLTVPGLVRRVINVVYREAGRYLLWSLLLANALAGCSVAKGKTPEDAAAALVDMQERLLRFTGSFTTGIPTSLERLQREGKGVDTKTVLTWKLVLCSAAVSIASGGNTRVNLLDMTVYVTLARDSVASNWAADTFGDAVRDLQMFFREAEEEIWRLSASILTPEQQKDLRLAIESWHRRHPLPEDMFKARTAGIAGEVVADSRTDTAKSGGMFAFLNLDPLANLDPAVREIAQTRLFAERALFVAERLPTILRWQAELLTMNTFDLPTIQQLTATTTQLSASVERITAVAEKLPERVSKEREELVKSLDAQEKTLSPVVREVHQTAEAGTAMVEALHETLKTLDALVKRLTEAGVIGGPPSPPQPGAEPFRIQDYTKAANQVEAATKQLTEAITAADQLLGSDGVRKLPERVAPIVERAESGARGLVNYAFTRVIVLLFLVLAAALAYRFLSKWMAAGPRAPGE